MCGTGDEGAGLVRLMLSQYEKLGQEGRKAFVELLMNTHGVSWKIVGAIEETLTNSSYREKKKCHCICTYAVRHLLCQEYGDGFALTMHDALNDKKNAQKHGFKYRDGIFEYVVGK